jgi:hypothetical protein
MASYYKSDFTVLVAESKVRENYGAPEYSYQTFDLKIQDIPYVEEGHVSLSLQKQNSKVVRRS